MSICSTRIIILALLTTLLTAAESTPRVLIVTTNHGHISMDDGSTTPTGYWLAEVAHPWTRFQDAGFTIHFASPQGGFSPMDPRSFDLDDAANRRFWETLAAVEGLLHNLPLASVDASTYDAIYFAGGHGTMWDFPDNPVVQDAILAIWEAGGIVAAVCHGPAALVGVRQEDGALLVDGKRLTAFSIAEERAVQLAEEVPFLLTGRLEEQGAKVVTADNWQEQVVVDGRLITGQNPASADAAGARI
ncbi:MAG: type 1 glutamine amidotransferase domain-containing protein, partial [Planctomycetota bacterium]